MLLGELCVEKWMRYSQYGIFKISMGEKSIEFIQKYFIFRRRSVFEI